MSKAPNDINPEHRLLVRAYSVLQNSSGKSEVTGPISCMGRWTGKGPEISWPRYSKEWTHCGQPLEVLPLEFKRSPSNWFYNNLGQGFLLGYFPDLLSKESITTAAAICWLRGIEPETGGE